MDQKTIKRVSWKEILTLAITLAVAIVLIGAIATTSTRWFALGALIALAVATAISLFVAPALCVPMFEKANANALAKASGYKGATKKQTAETHTEQPTENTENVETVVEE